MDIKQRKIKIRELVTGYSDDGEGGVKGYNGRLDIRPPFQREFVYKDKQSNAVIDTVMKNYPLNVMYWADNGDDSYEIIDGQQRTVSIARYIAGGFSFEKLYFHSLTDEEQNQILDYELDIYVCTGTEREKLDWFNVINTAPAVMTKQELRNAVFTGPWLADAKRWFSKAKGSAYRYSSIRRGKGGHAYLKGSAIRQDYLETALKWISNGDIEDYMGRHQHDADASELIDYFKSVIDWIESMFYVYRKPMQGVDWGSLYNEHRNVELNPDAVEFETQQLIASDAVRRLAGIYPYILTRDESHLNIRRFSDAVKQKIYEEQSGKCPDCGQFFKLEDMEADHKTPWSKGGRTIESNCQMLCKKCNKIKSNSLN